MNKMIFLTACCCVFAVSLQSQTTVTTVGDYAIGATVAATKMNVLYIGVDNPISVAVPGIKADKVSVSVSSGSIEAIGSGHYIIKVPSEMNGKTLDINVLYTNESGQMINGGIYPFRVKDIPMPVSYVLGVNSAGTTNKGNLTAMGKVIATLEGFEFDGVGFTVVSYSVTQSGTAKTINVNGNLFTKEVKDLINSCKSGDKLYFDNIKASGLDNTYKLAPVTVTIQ